jgi:tetratricopeptide (TPR) repeat protein
MRGILCFLYASLFFAAASVPAHADDWADCRVGALDARIAACSRIIENGGRNPKDLASARRLRSGIYGLQRENEKAYADLNEAIRIHPETAAYSRAMMRLIEKDNDGAIAEFTEAIKANQGGDIYNARGVAYWRKGEHDSAIADYSEALRRDPRSAVALSNRGRAYHSKGQPELALADLNQAIRLAPNYPQAYLNRALVFEKQGDIDDAIADCNKAIQIDPKYAEAYGQRAELYVSRNDFDRAIADASTAIELDPQFLRAYNIRGRAFGSTGELDDSLSDLNRAIELNAKLPYLYNDRGNTYFAKNELDRAITDYDFAIQLDAKAPLPYYNRGKAYEKKSNTERALADYRKVLDLPVVSNTDTQRQELVRQRIARLTQANRETRTASPSPAPPPAKRVALVIGNAKYASVGELINPANDAKGMATSLRRLGFGHIIELYDLNREKMGRALKEFGDWAENAEWAVVFYAGHGLEMNGVSYLIPTDAELVRDSHVADEAISLTQVQAKVDAASKLGLIILDSCRNNPFLARMARSGGTARAIGRGLAMVEPEGSVLVAYSAKHGTTASDGTGPNSPFSEALLAHIEEPGLEINFLFRKVRDEVRAKTQRQQEPFLYGSLSSEPLYFNEVASK